MSEPARSRKSSSSRSALSSLACRSRSVPTERAASIRRSSRSATKSSREFARRLVGELRVGVADGVADVGDDLQRVGVAELGAVALVEQLDELAELAHRDLPRAAASAGPVAGDRAQRLRVVAEGDRLGCRAR